MSLVYVSSSTIPSRYANSVHVMKMCSGFVKTGKSVLLIAAKGRSCSDGQIFKFYGVQPNFQICYYPLIGLRGGHLLFSLLSLWKIVRVRPQLVFGRNIIAGALGVIAGYRTVIEIHAPVDQLPKIERILLGVAVKKKKLLGIVVISPPLKLSLEKAYGIAIHQKILVAPDAADEIDSGEESIRLPGQEKFNVGYLGQLSPGRGIDLIQQIAIGNKLVDFHVIGGSEEDLLYWRHRCASLPNMHFHGFIPHGEAVKMLTFFDLLLAPYQKIVSIYGLGDTSKWMSPMKIFEYMAARKPILCSNLEILHEVLQDRVSCIFCDPDSANSWNDAITKIKENREYGEYLAENAYRRFVGQFTWSARAKNVLNQFGLFRSVGTPVARNGN